VFRGKSPATVREYPLQLVVLVSNLGRKSLATKKKKIMVLTQLTYKLRWVKGKDLEKKKTTEDRIMIYLNKKEP